MLHMKSKVHDSLTTMNHKWPVVAKDGKRSWRTSETLRTRDRIVLAAPSSDLPTEAKWSDALVELVGWAWTDGCFGSRNRTGAKIGKRQSATITQSHSRYPEKVARIARALTEAFGPERDELASTAWKGIPGWRRSVARPGATERAPKNSGPTTVFHLNRAAADVVRQALEGASDHHVRADFVDALTQSQLDLFIETSAAGDGVEHSRGRYGVAQRDRSRLDPFERACIRAGHSVAITHNSADMWICHVNSGTLAGPLHSAKESTRLGNTSSIVEVVSHEGLVWCPVVEGCGTWLARRNGRSFFTGNSGFGSWSIEGEFVRLQIAPMLRLIAAALTVAYEVEYSYDTSPLTVRPNKAVEAQALYDRGVIGDATLRASAGFTEDDAPEPGFETSPSMDMAMNLVRLSPSLVQNPGLPAVVDQCRIVLGEAPMYQEHYQPAEPAPEDGSTGDPVGTGPDTGPRSSRPRSDRGPQSDNNGKPRNEPGLD